MGSSLESSQANAAAVSADPIPEGMLWYSHGVKSASVG